MANNYTQFSELIQDVTKEEADWIKTVLGFDFDRPGDENCPICAFADLMGMDYDDVKAKDLDWWPGFDWELKRFKVPPETDKGELWLHCDEGFQEDCLIMFIQAFIRKFRPDYIFTLSAACFCDKPRIKEFGGFALVITKDEALGDNTWDWADARVEAIKTGNAGPEVD